MKKLTSILTLIGLLGGAAHAQVDVERFNRQIEQIQRQTRLLVNQNVPLDQRAYFDYGAFITSNFLTLDDSNLNSRTLQQYDFTAFARLNIDSAQDVFVRGRESYRDFSAGDKPRDNSNGFGGRLERAYYQFDLARYLAGKNGQQSSGDLTIKVGRDLAYWANGLTLSEEMDGAVVDLTSGPVTLELLAGRTPSDTSDIDSSRPGFDGHTNRAFYGAMLSARVGTHKPFVYALAQHDNNGNQTSVNVVNGNSVTTRFDYNSYYLGIGSTGALTDRLAYGVEAVYEGGDGLSSSVDQAGAPLAGGQSREEIRAWAADAQINYLLPDTHHTRFSGELILSSGDNDRQTTSNTFGGNQPGTRDNAFNAFGLLNTGLAFAPNVSNLVSLRGGVSFFPMPESNCFKRLQLGTDLFLFGKLDQRAPIDEPTNGDHYLGFEPDVYLNWQMTSDVTLAIRYGAFVPGSAIQNNGEIRQFFYTGVTFAF